MIRAGRITGERRGTRRASAAAGGSSMRWQGRPGSGNIEDRRGMGMGLPIGGGIGGLVLLLLISALTVTNPIDLLNTANRGEDGAVGTSGVRDADPQSQFVLVFLADPDVEWLPII